MENEELTELLPIVFRFALRLCRNRDLAEDLAQEAMLRALKQQGQLADSQRRKPWLLRITLNVYRDQYRRAQQIHWHSLDNASGRPVGKEIAPIEKLQRDEQIERAMQSLDRLPPRQRTVLHLIACEQLAIGEVAEILQISPGAVKSSLSIARRELREKLSGPSPLQPISIPQHSVQPKTDSNDT